MIKSNTRNFWSDNEVNCLLDIIKEQNILKLLDGKTYKNIAVFEKLEKEMKGRGSEKKSRTNNYKMAKIENRI